MAGIASQAFRSHQIRRLLRQHHSYHWIHTQTINAKVAAGTWDPVRGLREERWGCELWSKRREEGRQAGSKSSVKGNDARDGASRSLPSVRSVDSGPSPIVIQTTT